MQWVHCCYFKLLISHVFYSFEVLSTLQQIRVSWVLTIMQFPSPEIWKWYAVLLGIQAGSSN